MTVKSNFELDARIESMDDVQTCLHYDDSYIGERGYFASDLCDLSDLSKCLYGTLAQIILDGAGDDIFRTPHDVDYDNWGCRFFVPERLLKPVEKKYRPYTFMEFIKEYPLGSHLRFRPKSKTMEMHRVIDGYNDCLNGSGTLFLCGALFSMLELYDNYEIFKDGEWKPFGVEVEE